MEEPAVELPLLTDPWSNLLWPRSLEDAGWTWDQPTNSLETKPAGLTAKELWQETVQKVLEY